MSLFMTPQNKRKLKQLASGAYKAYRTNANVRRAVNSAARYGVGRVYSGIRRMANSRLANTRLQMSRGRVGAGRRGFRPSGRGYNRTFRRPRSTAASRATRKRNQKIWRIANPLKAPVTVRNLNSGIKPSAVNKCAYHTFVLNGLTDLNLYKGQATAKHQVASGASALYNPTETTYSYAVKLVRSSKLITMRNNGIGDCYIQATWYSCKLNTNFDPPSAWAEEMITKDADEPYTVDFYKGSTLYNIREKPQGGDGIFRDCYSAGKTRNVKLCAGGSCTFMLKSNKPKDWSNLLHYSGGEYIKGVSKVLVLRIVGAIGHSTDSNELVGIAPTRLDWVTKDQYDFNSDPAHREYKHYITAAGDLDTIAEEKIEFAGNDFTMQTPEPYVAP